jgi:hypothetical protein
VTATTALYLQEQYHLGNGVEDNLGLSCVSVY